MGRIRVSSVILEYRCPTTEESVTVFFDQSQIVSRFWDDVDSCDCCGTSVERIADVGCFSCGQIHEVVI